MTNIELAHGIGEASGRESYFQELMASPMISADAKHQILTYWQSQYEGKRRFVQTSYEALRKNDEQAG